MKNKTTIAGGITILIGLLKALQEFLSGQPIDFMGLSSSLALGGGLVFAKDHNVTGGDVSQPTVPNPPVLTENK